MSAPAAGSSPSRCTHCGLPTRVRRRRRSSRSETSGRESEESFCCLGCRVAYRFVPPADEGESDAGLSRETLRLGLGIFFTLNVMVASWVMYSRDLFGEDLGVEQASVVSLAAAAAMFLSTLVVVTLGFPLLVASFGSLRHRVEEPAVSARTLVVLGVFSAYALSIGRWMGGEGHLYFDTASVLLVVVTLGSALEAAARRRATASARELLADLPARARVSRDGSWIDVDRTTLRVGDVVEVLAGDVLPADGIVTAGSSWVDESSFTGEPETRSVQPGRRALAGSINTTGRLEIEVEEEPERNLIDQMERALETARSGRPPTQRLADRVSSLFAPAVVILALGVFLFIAREGDLGEALVRALTVLLISCPCALGLAAPLATWCGLRRSAERGILVDSAATLERAALIRRIAFDKTGTLTEPHVDLAPTGAADPRWAFAAAAGLAATSRHPVSRAVLEAAEREGIHPLEIQQAEETPGLGVRGQVDGRSIFLGRPLSGDPVGDRDGDRSGDPSAAESSDLVLADETRALARFYLSERLREGSVRLAEALRGAGYRLVILSGDRRHRVDRIGRTLAIPAEAELLPDEKVRRIRSLRDESGAVAMVGDGINDTLVLANADIGISVGTASELAARSGNVRMTTADLGRIATFFEIARDVRRRVRWNLFFAFGFNSIGLGLAVFGRLTPVMAAVAMFASSLVVIRISSRSGTVRGEGGIDPQPSRTRPEYAPASGERL